MTNDTNRPTSWRIVQTGIEKEELVDAGALSLEDLSSFSVYQLISPSTESLMRQDEVSLGGTLTCACGNEIPLNRTIGFKGFLDFPSKQLETCPQCHRGMMLVGETTGTGDSEKQWLLLTPATGKTGAVVMAGTPSGLPELSLDSIERILDESESLKKREEAVGATPKSEEEPAATSGQTFDTIEQKPVEQRPVSIGDDLMPSEVIRDLFNRERIDPGGKKILAFAIIYERDIAPAVWVGPGPDPFDAGSDSVHVRHLRFLASKIVPGYQPHYVPGHLGIGKDTAVAGRQFEPGESLDGGYINQVLAVMLADLLEDQGLLDDVELSDCSALSLSGNSVATKEARFALVVK